MMTNILKANIGFNFKRMEENMLNIVILKLIGFLFAILAVTTTLSIGSPLLLIFFIPFISIGVFLPLKIRDDLSFDTIKFASFLSQGIQAALIIEIVIVAVALVNLYLSTVNVGYLLFNILLSFLLFPLLLKEMKTNKILKDRRDEFTVKRLKTLEG